MGVETETSRAINIQLAQTLIRINRVPRYQASEILYAKVRESTLDLTGAELSQHCLATPKANKLRNV